LKVLISHIMKKAILLFISLLMVSTLYAQNSNVTKADAARSDGNLAEAIELIEPAIEHEKTMEKGRTWYVRAQIYVSVATSDDEQIRGLDPNAVQKAIDSFGKVKELEKPGSNYVTLADIQEQNFYSSIYNIGVTAYQDDQFEEAYEVFTQMILLDPQDTLGYMFAAYSAQAGENYDEALTMYYEAMNLPDCPMEVYNQTLILNEQIKKDYEKVLEVAIMAMEKFPEEQSYDRTAIAMYIKLEKTDEALMALQSALEDEPESANLWYNLGYLYGEVGEIEKSQEAYGKSIEIDPEYLNSYINLAYDYTQKANEILKQKEEFNTYDLIRKNQDKLAAIDAEADQVYKDALPLLQKADELSPDDQAILESLNGLYVRLKMTDEAAAIEKQLIALGFWEEN